MTTRDRESGTHLYLLLWKAWHAISTFDRKSIEGAGFGSISDFAVLELLLHKGPTAVNTIGERVLLTSGSITTAVQRLEKKGLVVRERSSEDARVVLVHLTEEGRRLIAGSFTEHADNLERLFAPLNGEERRLLADLVRKLGRHAEGLVP